MLNATAICQQVASAALSVKPRIMGANLLGDPRLAGAAETGAGGSDRGCRPEEKLLRLVCSEQLGLTSVCENT